jgi:uncharacterized protein (TIGR02145 family)
MITGKYLPLIALIISAVSLSSCTSMEPVILHGDISGSVTDAETSYPVQGALIELIQEDITDDSTRTGNDGSYLLKNITPGDYEIQASKFAYATGSKNIKVVETRTREIDLSLSGIPVPDISITYLDFSQNMTSLSFTISNIGKGELKWNSITSQDWITVSPPSGNVTNETDSITVIIDRTGLNENTYKETIRITSVIGTDIIQDTIGVYLNGVMDQDLNYYNIVNIGTQTWMAENLNVGKKLDVRFDRATNNGITERFCYYNEDNNCKIYGSIYQYYEAMQYHPSDTGTIGSTQGICPNGWHMPTEKEWLTLIEHLGGPVMAGGKLKESGTAHWLSPNNGATNETGFTALPGGYVSGDFNLENLYCGYINSVGAFWTASKPEGSDYQLGLHVELSYDNSQITLSYLDDKAYYVRCIKNP